MPSLSTLDPVFAPTAARFFAAWHRVSPYLVVTSARRTAEEQLRLWQASLAGANEGLPADPPGTSMHEKGLAFDMARPGRDPLADPLLRTAGAAWRRLGGVWHPVDPVHFAWSPSLVFTGWLSTRDGRLKPFPATRRVKGATRRALTRRPRRRS